MPQSCHSVIEGRSAKLQSIGCFSRSWPEQRASLQYGLDESSTLEIVARSTEVEHTNWAEVWLKRLAKEQMGAKNNEHMDAKTLGANTYLPTRYVLSSLWVLNQIPSMGPPGPFRLLL